MEQTALPKLENGVNLLLIIMIYDIAIILLFMSCLQVGRASTSGKVEIIGGDTDTKNPPLVLLSPDAP